ncbi:MAG: lipoyl synthase [Candidatus Omnitrophica bacterium]|nr:lipoyl synthase [Candidatus Omnitrophota bacterium]
MKSILKRPPWIRSSLSWDDSFSDVRTLVKELGLNTVCVEAACPNRCQCWSDGHVTFMVLGRVCTRGCLFCNVEKGTPVPPDAAEAANIAIAAKKLNARYVVITSVTRDDLPDRGAGHFVSIVRQLKSSLPGTAVELLIPDLDAREELIARTTRSGAEVIGHNIEMPERLYSRMRPGADYHRSLRTIRTIAELRERGQKVLVKSALMLGLGERPEEVLQTLRDLKEAGVDIVYIGQYLSPSADHWPIEKYYTPEQFESLKEECFGMGFRSVLSGPMVRSSYKAAEAYRSALDKS